MYSAPNLLNWQTVAPDAFVLGCIDVASTEVVVLGKSTYSRTAGKHPHGARIMPAPAC